MPRVRKKPAEKRTDLRDAIWPGSEEWIWSRHSSDGFATVPATAALDLAPFEVFGGRKQKGRSLARVPRIVVAQLRRRSRDDQGRRRMRLRGWLLRESGVQDLVGAHAHLGGEGFHPDQPGRLEGVRAGAAAQPARSRGAIPRQKKIPDGWWPSFHRRAEEIGARLPPALKLPADLKRMK